MSSLWMVQLLCFAFLTLHPCVYGGDPSEEHSTAEALRVDTCTLQPETHEVGETFRAVTPTEAGREGLSLRHTNASVTVKYDNHLTDQSYTHKKSYGQQIFIGMKFYADIPQHHYNNVFLKFFDFGVALTKDGDIAIHYVAIDGQTSKVRSREVNTGIAMPSECLDLGNANSNTNTDNSGWIELTGIKVKVSPREKRSVDDACWKMIGIKFTINLRLEAHLDVYVNGKKTTRTTISMSKELSTQMMHPPANTITVTRGSFSCIEVAQGEHPESYYEDLNLNECQKEYNGQPEEKFI